MGGSLSKKRTARCRIGLSFTRALASEAERVIIVIFCNMPVEQVRDNIGVAASNCMHCNHQPCGYVAFRGNQLQSRVKSSLGDRLQALHPRKVGDNDAGTRIVGNLFGDRRDL